MNIVPVPMRKDNYAYLCIDGPSQQAAAIDPYDLPKVKAAADKLGVHLVAAITTHHHFDHSGGNEVRTPLQVRSYLAQRHCRNLQVWPIVPWMVLNCVFQASTYRDAVIYGGSDKIPALTNLVKDNDEFTIGDNIHVKYAGSSNFPLLPNCS
jgi:hydroxyacylglutathione hydrolase